MKYVLPKIIINLKNYKKGLSLEGFSLVNIVDEVACRYDQKIGVAVNNIDLKDFLRLKLQKTQIWCQHIDETGMGASTGAMNSEYIAELGCMGTLLNHSEKRISLTKVDKTITRLNQLKILSLICTSTLEEGSDLSFMEPDAIAFEPADLIGGEVSVSKSKPELIKQFVDRLEIPVFVGAGIKTPDDVRKSFDLGAYGVLVASGIVQAEKPMEILESFLKVVCEYVEE